MYLKEERYGSHGESLVPPQTLRSVPFVTQDTRIQHVVDERERRVSVYEEAPGFRLGLRSTCG
jgi:hypothetical protein